MGSEKTLTGLPPAKGNIAIAVCPVSIAPLCSYTQAIHFPSGEMVGQYALPSLSVNSVIGPPPLGTFARTALPPSPRTKTTHFPSGDMVGSHSPPWVSCFLLPPSRSMRHIRSEEHTSEL